MENGNDILFEKYLIKQFPFVKSVSIVNSRHTYSRNTSRIHITLSPSHFCEVYFKSNTEEKVKDMLLGETSLLLWSLYPEISRDSNIEFSFFPELSDDESILKFTNESFQIF